MSGYDKFFKDAGQASGLRSGKPASKSTRASSKASSTSASKPRFAMASPHTTETAEDRLRKEVALRARARKQNVLRKKQAFPVFPAIIAVVALISCTIGFVKPDLADQVLSHVDIGFFGKAIASEKTEKSEKKDAARKSAEPAKEAAAKPAALADAVAAAKNENTPDIRSWSPDELSFFNKLNDRKKELDLRESELTKLEEELQKQKAELDEKIKQLEAMRGQISKTLQTRVSVDQEKVEKLVQFYSTMKPPQAAKVIESLNEDLAVEVMDKMKKKNAAEIMNALDAKKARRLSELLTGYQRIPASAGESTAAADGEKE